MCTRYNNCICRLHRQPLLTAMSLPSSLAGFPRFLAFLARFPASNWILRIDCQSRSSSSFGCWTGRGWSVDGGTTRVAGGVSSRRTQPRRCGVGTATGAALPRTEPTASADAGGSADARESGYSHTTPVSTATLPRLRRRPRHAARPPAPPESLLPQVPPAPLPTPLMPQGRNAVQTGARHDANGNMRTVISALGM